MTRLRSSIIVFLIFIVVTVGVILLSNPTPLSSTEQAKKIQRREDVTGGTALRIMPLGDSITWGVGQDDTDGNAYRGQLFDRLSGSTLTFIGSNPHGSMAQNQNEGHPGATINGIAEAAKASLPQRPNVILIHAGTNDLFKSPTQEEPYDQAPNRLGNMLDQIISACPDATILVAQIIHDDDDSGGSGRVATYNAQIPAVVAARVAKGHQNIAVVDMTMLGSHDEMVGIHPKDSTYKKMGDIFFDGIKDAASKGWIKDPVGPDPGHGGSSGAQKCLSGLFLYQPDGGKIEATGVGHNGNQKFTNNWGPRVPVASGLGNYTGIRLADLDGDGRADYLWVDPKTGAMRASLNRIGLIENNWLPVYDGKDLVTGVGKGEGVHFADVNGDGRAVRDTLVYRVSGAPSTILTMNQEYLYVYDDGHVDMWINGGPIGSGGWNFYGPTQFAAGNVAKANQKNVMFADINGDNRTDYVVKSDTGALTVFLNIGKAGSDEHKLVPFGQIASGLGNSAVVLADLDGDGRDDYLMWDKGGGLSGYLNIRGKSEGLPNWIRQGGDNDIARGSNTKPEYLRLADMDGDGKDDYCILDPKTGGIDVQYNGGSADTSTNGDGVIFADLTGSGKDDYVFVDTNGALTVYVNGGPNPQGGWIWYPQNNNQPIANGAGAQRHQVRLADLNGDGKADFIIVDDTGSAVAYQNNGPDPNSPDGWKWDGLGPIASGIGDGAGVRFADINGDGRADFIHLDKDGVAVVYINDAGGRIPSWDPLNDKKPVALGVGGYRQDIRFADVTGDGKADYLWVHPEDGSVDVYVNVIGELESNWVPLQDQLASGIGFSSASVQFARLDDSGRAGYIPIIPESGAFAPYLNGCKNLAPASDTSSPGGGGGSGGGGSGGSGGGGSGGGGGGSGGGGNGAGNASGQSEGPTVYIDPSIWTTQGPVAQCKQPCTLVLPPFQLQSTLTLSWPPITTSVLSSSGGTVRTKTTVLSIPPVTTTAIDFWPITIGPDDKEPATITPQQSVMPPSTLITLPATEASIQITESTASTTTSYSIVPPVFPTSSHVITFQPQPTVSAPIPPPGPPPGGGPSPISFKSGDPGPICQSNCGHINCDFGCGGGGRGGGGGGGGCGCGGGKSGGRGGSGGSGNPDDPNEPDDNKTSSTSSSSSTSSCSTTTTTGCDTICTVEGDDCYTTCHNLTHDCRPAPTQPPVFDLDWSGPQFAITDDEAAAISSVAAFMNPILNSFDPVVYGSKTFTDGLATKTSTGLTNPIATVPRKPKPGPQAACEVQSNGSGRRYRPGQVYVNYDIPDRGEDFRQALIKDCRINGDGWLVSESKRQFTTAEGTKWTATQFYNFDINLLSAQDAECIKEAVKDSKGPTEMPDCVFVNKVVPG
ncbi:MAG: hypothetical protein Q9170_005496 [Blastenia crenularia]